MTSPTSSPESAATSTPSSRSARPVTGEPATGGTTSRLPKVGFERRAAGDRGVTGASSGGVLAGARRQRFEARKVRRLVRHIDPWSVLKLSVLLALSFWLVTMIASFILWQVAVSAGTVESIEKFVNTSFELENWRLDGGFLFRQVGLVALIASFAAAGAVVVATLVFNLISDIIGGIWVSVVEEETARPVGPRD